jgi:hydrocephalus-inducing protein
VTFESSRPDRGGGGEQQNWSLKGNDYLDVPGNGKKEYKVTFYAHKESTAQTKVVFRNETTGEYCFYELTLKAVRGGSLGTIELFTQVRVLVGHSMRLENPLGVAATFTATCTNAHEILLPTSVTIPARSQGEFAFEYLPMRSGESSAKLEINSAELGSYLYDLKLRAALAPHERALYFRAHLGQSQTVTAKFTNFCRQKADYSCKVQ